MRPTTVLLTGAGGAPIPFLIECLRKRGYRVLVADMDPMAGGLLLADAGYVIPAGLDPAFLPVIRGICREQKVDVLIPLVDEELACAITLESPSLKVLTPRLAFIELVLDKFQLARALSAAKLPAPATFMAKDGPGHLPYPLVLKPRVGRGSRGLHILNDPSEWENACRHLPSLDSYIIQEFIQGPEYTVSVMMWRDGVVQAVVPKLILDKRGITRQAVTQKVAAIEQLAMDVQNRFRADGPFNMQLRICNRTGKPTIFEINPRFSTTVTLTHAAGVDEVGLLVEQAVGRRASEVVPWQADVRLIRSTKDIFMNKAEWVIRNIPDVACVPPR